MVTQSTKVAAPGGFGIDIDYLKTLPTGGAGLDWPVSWKVAIQSLFVNGYSATDIDRYFATFEGLKYPSKDTVYRWIGEGDWSKARDEFQRRVAEKALARQADDKSQVVSRHLKQLRAIQAKLMTAVVSTDPAKALQAKSLEGAAAAMVALIRQERSVLGLNDDQVVVNDNRVQTIVNQMEIPPERREAWFEAQSRRFEIDEELARLAAPPEENQP